eukprot:758417-Hanusia_phi.AAC.10
MLEEEEEEEEEENDYQCDHDHVGEEDVMIKKKEKDMIQVDFICDPYRWKLGVQMQTAAGGSGDEEASAVAMLEHALLLSPALHASFDNMMRVGDLHRGLGNSTRARRFYLLAISLNPRVSTSFVYVGLTFEQE